MLHTAVEVTSTTICAPPRCTADVDPQPATRHVVMGEDARPGVTLLLGQLTGGRNMLDPFLLPRDPQRHRLAVPGQ
ncbi:MAG TPA: hypothetical protein VHH34_16105 [Pseudonocardiaceae bacterium]|nr:hypothetical protein [Pseudonocardiaceae bacterium]